MARVAARVEDAETGAVIPATVAIRPGSGSPLREHPGYSRGFRSNGVFDKEVPAGPISITIRRGFDYGGETRTLELKAGERADLTFKLRRRTSLRRLGWYCGDSHAHMIHGQREISADFDYVALAARAEALDYLSLAQRWNIATEDPRAIEQACRRVSTTDLMLTWNMESPKNYWRGDVSHCMGHGWTFGMRGYTADGRDAITQLDALNAHDYESEKAPAPNFESHALIHELGGIVSYTHPCRWWWGKWGGQAGFPLEEKKFVSNMAAELPFDTVAGPTYDTIDVLMQTREREANGKTEKMWFMLLNKGYRIPATASSDATFDNPGSAVPGAVRVYTHVDGTPSIEAIKSAMKAGRNFVTSGPLVIFTMGGHMAGDVVRVRGRMRLPVSVQAWASGEPGEGLRKIELIRNGVVAKTFEFDRPVPEFTTTFDIDEAATSWYVLRCTGSGPGQVALANPIYFEDSSYHAPQPTQAQVQIQLANESGEPIEGICEVLRMVGSRPVVQSRHQVRNGSLAVQAPATARLRLSSPGRQSETRSIFADTPALLQNAFDIRDDQLPDWATYERIKQLLANVRMDVRLRKQR